MLGKPTCLTPSDALVVVDIGYLIAEPVNSIVELRFQLVHINDGVLMKHADAQRYADLNGARNHCHECWCPQIWPLPVEASFLQPT